jgi:ribonuclease HI
MMCQSTWSKGKEAKAVKEVTLFTDGSCLGNPGPGGWACILRYGKHERILRGAALRTTNNRMEREAAINGLLVLTERCSVTVITDSKYLQQGVTVYLVRWQSRGWCNSRGEAIANWDLWKRLASVAGHHETKWRWVRGHGSDPNQDRCDGLAKESARMVTTGGTAGELAA